MAAAVSASYDLRLSVTETLALALDHASDPSFAHQLTQHTATLTGTSTPAVTKVFSDTVALVSGVLTLDLTALAGPAGTTVDFTGLTVQLIKLACPAGNTGGITVDSMLDATGYNLLGRNNVNVVSQTIAPALYDTTFDGVGVDLADVETAIAVVNVGTITDGAHTPVLEESDDDIAYAAVGGGDMIRAFGGMATDTPQWVRYIGDKQYVMVSVTVAGGPVTGGVYGAVIVGETNKYNVLPGTAVEIVTADELEAVDATHKHLVLTGTGTDTMEILLVAG